MKSILDFRPILFGDKSHSIRELLFDFFPASTAKKYINQIETEEFVKNLELMNDSVSRKEIMK